MSKIQEFQEIINKSQNIVFFGGAGVSTASGIPDFRSAKGLFMQESGFHYPPEEIISHSFFEEKPEIFFQYYSENLVNTDAQPNKVHNYLTILEEKGKNVDVVTQNIDGLHQLAGNSKVHELHGSVLENYCLTCNKHYQLNELQKDNQGIPRCIDDHAIVRPNVILYEEQLDQEVMNKALEALTNAELLIIAGTSLSVYPAAGMVNWFNGEHVVVVNNTSISTSNHPNALVFEDDLSNVFSKLD